MRRYKFFASAYLVAYVAYGYDKGGWQEALYNLGVFAIGWTAGYLTDRVFRAYIDQGK